MRYHQISGVCDFLVCLREAIKLTTNEKDDIAIDKSNKFLNSVKWSYEININDESYLSLSQFNWGEVDSQDKENILKQKFERESDKQMNNEDAIKKYKQHLRGRGKSESTIKNNAYHVNRFLKEIGKLYNEITQNEVDCYCAKCYKKYKQNGNHTRFFAIRQFFDFIYNTKKYFDIFVPNIVETQMYTLTRDELKELFKASRDNPLERVIVCCLMYGEMRPKDIMNLKINNRKGDRLFLENTKRGNRPLIMSKDFQKSWEDYEKVRPEPLLPEHKDIFIIQDKTSKRFHGKPYVARESITNIVKRIAERCGIKADSYTIRRTFITEFLKDGIDPKIVQLQAGHKKISTTMRYNRVNEDHIRNSFNNSSLFNIDEDKKEDDACLQTKTPNKRNENEKNNRHHSTLFT